MKLDEKTKRLIVIGIGATMIMLGLLGAVFKIKIKIDLLNQISTILLFIAAMILFSGRKWGRKAEAAPEPEKTEDSTVVDEDDPNKKE